METRHYYVFRNLSIWQLIYKLAHYAVVRCRFHHNDHINLIKYVKRHFNANTPKNAIPKYAREICK